MELAYQAESTHYIVMANYLWAGASALPKDYPRVMGMYEGRSPGEAMEQFMKEFCPDVRTAQMFFNEVTVIEVNPRAHQYKLSDFFGDLAQFPNREIFNDDHMYF